MQKYFSTGIYRLSFWLIFFLGKSIILVTYNKMSHLQQNEWK